MKTGLKALSELALKKLVEKHPGFPTHALPIPKYKDTSANCLTQSIYTWLTLNGHYATRINTTGIYDVKLKRHRKGTTKLGAADLHCIVGGRHLSIEVKYGKDRLSEHQKRTQDDIIKSGGLYFIARDFQSFYEYYQSITQ